MHGVFDFRERSPFNPTRMVGVTSRSICSETFLHVLSRHNRRDRLISILAQMDIFSFLDSPEERGGGTPCPNASRPQETSPLIDAGTNADVPEGFAGKVRSDRVPDVGADEYVQ